jgi:hypothetical protein
MTEMFEMYGFREIPVFKIDDDWEKWLRSLQIYFTANSVKDDEIMLAKLLHWAGREIQELFEVLPGAKIQKDTKNNVYDVAVGKFTAYFKSKQSKLYERYKFYNLAQSENENIEQFAYKLRKQANKCQFNNDIDEYIRDQITFKTNSEELRIHILKQDDIKLDDVISHGKALEALLVHKKAFEKPKEIINKIQTKTIRNVECYRCGRKSHIGSDQHCPALQLKCNKCNKQGHFASKCRTKFIDRRENKRKAESYRQNDNKRFRNDSDLKINMISDGDL